MITTIKETVRLHNGVEIPQLGYGVFKVENGRQTDGICKKGLRSKVSFNPIRQLECQYELIPYIIYKKNPTRVGT